MKKSIVSKFILFVLLTVLVISGCAPAPTPVPPTNTLVPTATQPPPTATPKPESAFYALSRSGVVTRTSLTGATKNILEGVSGYGLQVLDYNLYLCNPEHSKILVYNLDGNPLREVTIPSDIHFLEFTALPDGGFALLSNYDDKVYFIDSKGEILSTANILDNRDDHGQNLSGIVAGNRLILSEDGKKHILAFDLSTHEKSTFKDLKGLPGAWLGAITYSDNIFYLTTSDTIYKFTDTSDATRIAKLPKGNITGIVILDGFAFVSVNITGEIYKVNITDGTISLFATGLDFPNNLVFSK